MLRDFEHEICRVTGAQKFILPEVNTSFQIGTRYQNLRKLVPRENLEVPGEVIWCVLMGPENCKLDLLKMRTRPGAIKILYLFDSFEHQLPAINYMLSRTEWDVLITSFEEAVPLLEESTSRKWHAVYQGVKEERFTPAPPEQRIIGICSYGRRIQRLHEVLLKFCKESNIYYDFTSWQSVRKDIDADDLYRQYAWHLTHSVFSINLPVEISHPERAGKLHPVTCRWFEAAAAGTIILGMPPRSPTFLEMFPAGMVNTVDLSGSERDIVLQLRAAWEKRSELLQFAQTIRGSMIHNWSWESRIHQIQQLAQLNQTAELNGKN
jgi:hypothetical protein